MQAPIPVGYCHVLRVLPESDGCLTVGKNVDITTRVALFYILHYTSLNGTHFSLEYHGVKPKIESVPSSQTLSAFASTSAGVCRWDLSVYQNRPPLSSELNLFCHSHLPRNLTVNGLWYAFLGSIISDPIYRKGTCFISRERHDSNCNIISIHCDDTENSCKRLVMAWP